MDSHVNLNGGLLAAETTLTPSCRPPWSAHVERPTDTGHPPCSTFS